MFVRRDLTDFVPTPEGNIHFVTQGDGYPLVLLHPLGTSTWAWSGVIDALSEHYTCYAFDMLGHGESDKPPRDFNLPDYARFAGPRLPGVEHPPGPRGGELGGRAAGRRDRDQLPGTRRQAGPGGMPGGGSQHRGPTLAGKRRRASTRTACLGRAPQMT